MKIVIAFVLFVSASTSLFSQDKGVQNIGTITIKGIVKEADNKTIIPFATVTLLTASDSVFNVTLTDSSGIFSFPDLPAYGYSIQIKAIGFRDTTITGLPGKNGVGNDFLPK